MRRILRTEKLVRGLGWTAGLTIFLSLLALFLAHGGAITPGQAAGASLAVDDVTDGNAAFQLGPTDSCRSVAAGTTFDVDLTVRGVADLRAWELYFGFNPALLKVVGQDVRYMLGAGARDVSDPVPDSNGHHYLGAFTLGATASGSGVLARLTLQALAPGFSPANISAFPAPPLLNPGSDIPIDGIENSRIAIGTDCAGAPPPGPTASPLPTPSPEPPPSPSPTPSPSPEPIASPLPTASPEYAPSPSPTPRPEPTPTLAAGSNYWGDVDCDARVTIGDAQKVARNLIGLPITQAPSCSAIGATVTADGTALTWGDVDCNSTVTVGDAQKVARNLVGLPTTQGAGCPGIGSVISTG